MNRHPFNLILALLLAALLSACATPQNNYDPIEPVNRVTDKVNDGIDRVTLKPLARGYTAAVPKPMRTAVSNFFENATYLNTVLNDFLQGKGEQGFSDLFRFLVNTTLGAGGLVDVASSMGLERHDEDLGQTLAVWGVGESAYIVYPLLGPNSLRNTPDFITATATDPLFWLSFTMVPAVTIPIAVVKYVDQRAQLLEASDMRDELALDPYIFTREAWRQNRLYLIHDGNPPKAEPLGDDGWEEEDWGSKDDGWQEDEFDRPAESGTESIESAPAADENSAEPENATHPSDKNIDAPAEKEAEPLSGNMFRINLASFRSETAATNALHMLRSRMVDSELETVTIDNQRWYRLHSSELVSGMDAKIKLQDLRSRTGIQTAWLEPVSP
ncbi:ABC-type transporter Mla maintaining outer membrane lipid asymmetry, lipoprotein component MlaA [Mariprofundus ferrinatatus]|uniref:ABC-type transporter Mla maintaining outer membrane lipid asymmetry, lipoprotein component MlaA n=1 Tax=Mariprofundus ferrinatatus TaxID=1921087 RepID=A0A2K8L5M4_9PROT|nr:VacJ family lipoprotein [Mariprofundus ferrinatatus]ATX82620.1 ABC-type transporter Mla maintaining outer membrane lipid asymmetry, lipoprotein component MlaA [Mariprofundus ferrinatatus]